MNRREILKTAISLTILTPITIQEQNHQTILIDTDRVFYKKTHNNITEQWIVLKSENRQWGIPLNFKTVDMSSKTLTQFIDNKTKEILCIITTLPVLHDYEVIYRL